MKKFETPAAARQYEQILCRESGLMVKLRGVVAMQYISADTGPLKRFEPFENALLCILTSGMLAGREITRFTIMRGAHEVVDWDLHRVCRVNGPRHVPNPHSKFFEFAMALDKARAIAAAGGTLPLLNKCQLPNMFIRSVSPAALPIADKYGQLCVPAALSAEYHQLGTAEKIAAAKTLMLSGSIQTTDGVYTPVELVDPALSSRLEFCRNLTDWLGVTIANPLAKYLEMPNPMASSKEELAAARKRMGDAHALYHDEDLLEASGNLIRASGKRQATVAEMTPLLRRCLGVAFGQMTESHLKQMIAFPATPVAVDTIGKPKFFWKGAASNTAALQELGVPYPELPKCFLPQESK